MLARSRSRLRHALWRQTNAPQGSTGQNLVASRAGRVHHSQGSHTDSAGGAIYRVHAQSRQFGPPSRVDAAPVMSDPGTVQTVPLTVDASGFCWPFVPQELRRIQMTNG